MPNSCGDGWSGPSREKTIRWGRLNIRVKNVNFLIRARQGGLRPPGLTLGVYSFKPVMTMIWGRYKHGGSFFAKNTYRD